MNQADQGGAANPDAPQPPVHRFKKITLFFLKYVLGLSLIAWMVWSGKVDLSAAASLSSALVLQCMALMGVQTLLAAFRVRYILAHQNIKTSVAQCILYNCSGVLYSAFLPGGISGDAVRAYLFMKAIPDHRLAILGAMFLDRLLGLITMVTLGLCAALVMAIKLPVIRPYLLLFGGIFLALVGGLALVNFLGRRHRHEHREIPLGRFRLLWAKISRVIAELRVHHYETRVLGGVVLQSVLIHLTAVTVIYLCSVYSRSTLGFFEVFIATPIGLLVNAVPLSPGGLGIGENAFELLYRAIGGANGGTSFLLSRLFLYSPALIGLGYVVWRMVAKKR